MKEKAIRKNRLAFLMAFLFFLTLSFLIPSVAIGLEQEVGIGALVSVCDNDGICEPERGENAILCPLDCLLPVIRFRDIVPPIISNLLVSKITFDSAIVSWDTNEQALCEISWGENRKYDKGNISEIGFSFKHSIQLTGLSPATLYYFKVKCQDLSNNKSEKEGKFITLLAPDITPPVNISNFEAIPGDKKITLKWQNPPDLDFKAVMIRRSTVFFPTSPEEGELAFDGKDTSFIDTGLTNGKRYYYTAFSYDFSGNFSSGAIVSAVPFKIKPLLPEEIFTEKECLEAGYYWYDDACHREPKIVPPPPEVEKITIDDFDFIQAGRKIPIIDGKLEIKKEESLEISINYDKVPEVLKTITVTLEKGEKFFSFLLRINKEKTVYLATLMPPEEPGIYPITIAVLDYKNQTIKKLFGELEVKAKEIILIKWWQRINILHYFLAILILLIIGVLYKKRREDRKKRNHQ